MIGILLVAFAAGRLEEVGVLALETPLLRMELQRDLRVIRIGKLNSLPRRCLHRLDLSGDDLVHIAFILHPHIFDLSRGLTGSLPGANGNFRSFVF